MEVPVPKQNGAVPVWDCSVTPGGSYSTERDKQFIPIYRALSVTVNKRAAIEVFRYGDLRIAL